MSSVADICNIGLSLIGADATITSITPSDGSVEAGLCARFYPIVRKTALEEGIFTWSKTRTALATVANPSTVWAYAYALPADCLSPKRVLQQTALVDFLVWPWGTFLTVDELNFWTERGTADFEVEDGVLLTNEPEAVLLYTRDVTDTTKFTEQFCLYLAMRLGAMLAGPIIKGDEGRKTATSLLNMAARQRASAAMDDANGSAERGDHLPQHIRSR